MLDLNFQIENFNQICHILSSILLAFSFIILIYVLFIVTIF